MYFIYSTTNLPSSTLEEPNPPQALPLTYPLHKINKEEIEVKEGELMEQIEENKALPSSAGKTGAIDELRNVLVLVKELGVVVQGSPLVGEIAIRVTKALAGLEAVEKEEEGLGPMAVGSPCFIVGKSENSTLKKKSRPGAGDKKLVHRRRSHPCISTKTSSTLEDGYTWRKYGQKEILSAKHPRSYYRCTHKHARGCQATRQTQKSEDDDTIYHVTYIGHHTCREAPKSTGGGGGLESRLISFGPPLQVEPQEPMAVLPAIILQSPPPTASMKQECVEQDVVNGLTYAYLSSPVLTTPVESSIPITVSTPDIGSERGDMTSGFVSMESSMDESFDILEMLNLDHNDMEFRL